ncbi:MAG: PEP-CTERM system histidine kinase PrsK, partial [Sphingomonadales bacterium]
MATQLIVWGHALAALLFGGLTILAWRVREAHVPRRALVAALATTALWALAVAGIGGAEMVTRVSETVRNLAWLGFMLVLHRRGGSVRPPLAIGTVYGVVGTVAVAALVVHIVGSAADPLAAPPIETAGLLLRMLVAVAALVLVQALYSALLPSAGGGLRWIVAGLAGIWCANLVIFTLAYLSGRWETWEFAARGFAMIFVALAIGTGLQRKGEWNVQVSRTVAYQ